MRVVAGVDFGTLSTRVTLLCYAICGRLPRRVQISEAF